MNSMISIMAADTDVSLHDLRQTISVMVGLHNFISVVAFITSGMIIHFLKNKPLGTKTVLDMIAIDTCYSQICGLIIWCCNANLGHFHGEVNYEMAEMSVASGVLALEILLANAQSYIAMNAILIFKPELVIDVTDETVLKYNRAFVLGYSLLSKLLDTSTPQNPVFMDYMTGKDETSYLGIGLGLKLQLVFLLISLIVFQIYKPTELAEKGRLFLKLIGCVIGLLFFIISGASLNDNLTVDLKDSKEFLFLTTYIGNIVILGWTLPAVFISGYQSLKGHFSKLIAIPLNCLIALSSSTGIMNQNKVDNK